VLQDGHPWQNARFDPVEYGGTTREHPMTDSTMILDPLESDLYHVADSAGTVILSNAQQRSDSLRTLRRRNHLLMCLHLTKDAGKIEDINRQLDALSLNTKDLIVRH
jgi:hypothetical protein